MAYAHVAHDCVIGNNVTMMNLATLGGHVEIDDWAMLSGCVMVHQFVKIGTHSFISGLFRVSQDVPPFVMAVGEPLRYGGINSVGLRRRGFSSKDRINIKRAYRYYFNSGLKRSVALEKIKSEFPDDKNILSIVDFIEKSKRGII
jgi:UDP-N-acetylglucosamine acyltransferase